MAERIVAALASRARHAAAERVRSRPAATLEGYELVLKAGFALATYGARQADEALELLDRALRVDDRHAAAWTLVARANLRLYLHPLDERHLSPAVLARAREAAVRAVSLDPDSASAHAALGNAKLWERRYDESLASLRRAVELHPHDVTALYWYGDALGRAGEHRPSMQVLERVRTLDPFSPPHVLGQLARAYLMLGDYDRALSLARDSTVRDAGATLCLGIQAIATYELGFADESAETRRRLVDKYPGYSTRLRRFRDDRDEAKFLGYLRRAGFTE
ncbi:MAG TPA: tetratricopeptide repeat protein [Burkholderiaceae bacterium]|nr:tetratricopeptide repeat protein [Burkholderiaceae bacterium]